MRGLDYLESRGPGSVWRNHTYSALQTGPRPPRLHSVQFRPDETPPAKIELVYLEIAGIRAWLAIGDLGKDAGNFTVVKEPEFSRLIIRTETAEAKNLVSVTIQNGSFIIRNMRNRQSDPLKTDNADTLQHEIHALLVQLTSTA